MARATAAVSNHRRHKKVLKLAKGYFGARSKLFKTANQSVIRAMRSAYVGRRLRKRDFRKLWIIRINAAARINGLSYSRFICGLKSAGVAVNRKIMADLAVNDPAGFASLVETARAALV